MAADSYSETILPICFCGSLSTV